MKIHHIGYAVNSIEKTMIEFEKLGYIKSSEIVDDVARGVKICFMENNGYSIELVQGLTENSPVKNTLNKIGVGPYHICYSVDNIEKSIEELKKDRYMLVEKVSLAPAIGNSAVVAFLYKLNVGLIELVGEKN